MLTENDIIINEISWAAFSDNLSINANKNYVFRASVESYYAKIDDHYLSVLTAQELNKASRYRQESDRKQFIVARYLVRNILAKIGLLPVAAIDFQYNEFNKPFVGGIEFNISHSGDYVVIAISSQPIGIDVEVINYDFDYTSLIPTIFSEEETEYINQSKTIGFYTLWTRKEAILKATGEGLTDDIEEDNCLNNLQYRKEKKYFLTSFKIGNYIASLATNANYETMFLHFD
jgi:4'-phosphopantetheinyl transferase